MSKKVKTEDKDSYIDILDEESASVRIDHANHTLQQNSDCLHKTEEIMEHPITQLILILLVFIDCGIVIAELLIDRDAIRVEDVEDVKEAFHYTSIMILGIFLFEVALKICVEGLAFFLHYIEVLDALVVIISFIVDIMSLVPYFYNHVFNLICYARAAENKLRGIGLLIILRLWRIARIVNGIIASVKKHMRKRLETITEDRNRCRRKLNRAIKVARAKVEEIKLLEGILEKEGIEYRQIVAKTEQGDGDPAEVKLVIEEDIIDDKDNLEEEHKSIDGKEESKSNQEEKSKSIDEKEEGKGNQNEEGKSVDHKEEDKSLETGQTEKSEKDAQEGDKRSSRGDSDAASHHSERKADDAKDNKEEVEPEVLVYT
ncbi:Voltage-gated hydrogen channel 1 [Trichoplax sp. H2]|uniref:Voltage-gated hydrogen channel 1 n=1 Tax=Trichoplax adhaerens TaxID=10228 RepID=B3RRS1_TRIAD|nr:hypothetical protein TRIADDRAFT_54343 [Trichoplax adhaerens]EDV26400.1 hypothetical protein TRIADDRAFT_54343 [Trichoplax adhaerens]RDD43771.1 Voltage-gated hydrogen channel 1 [Trichoplax sp. H2]|eukprot:XP_002110396.1 hypothetical protein TRIADDRAFT_54343 [Trichoplax adhaerens]